jgi:hypothetical protein
LSESKPSGFRNSTATATTGADGASADVGTTDDGTSGMDSMKIYLTAIAANTLNNAQVNFDTVSTFDDSETTTTATTLNILGSTTLSATTNDATVLKMTPAVANTAAGASTRIAEKAGFIITAAAGSNDFGTIQFTYGGTALFDTTVNGAGTAVTLNNANKNSDVSALESAINVSRASNAGLTLDAKRGGNSTHSATIRDIIEATSTAVLGERYTTVAAVTAANTATNYGLGADDYVTMTLGSNSVTGTGASSTTLAASLYAAYVAKYATSGTASASAIATMTSPTTGTGASQAIAFTMLQTDSGGYDVALSFSASAGTVTASSAANVDWTIGSTNNTTDNGSVDGAILMTLASTDTTGATPLTAITTAITNATSMTVYALTTNYLTNTAWADGAFFTGTNDARTDVRTAEAAVAAATTNAVAVLKFNRVTWLG